MRVEPVAETTATPSWAARAAPTSAPPWSTWLRPAGAPTSAAARCSRASHASAVSGVLSDGFQSTGSPATRARAAFHDHTATGKLNAVMTAHGPIGCHVSIRRWPGRSLAIVSPCSCRDSPTAKSQMSIISWTSPRPSERILPASIDTSSPRSALWSRSSSPRRCTRAPRTGAGVVRHVANASVAMATARSTSPTSPAAPSEPPVIGRAGAELAGAAADADGIEGGDDLVDQRAGGRQRRRHAGDRQRRHGVGEDRQRGVGLLGGHDERRGHADRAPTARQHEQAALEARPLQRLGRVVVGEVDADHQAAAAHVLEQRVLGLQGPQAGEQPVADHGGVVGEAVLDELERGDGGGARHRVAAERRAVAAGQPVHDRPSGR